MERRTGYNRGVQGNQGYLAIITGFPCYREKQYSLQDNPAFIKYRIFLQAPCSTLFGIAINVDSITNYIKSAPWKLHNCTVDILT